jgi:ketosteroid isomerase-like protein
LTATCAVSIPFLVSAVTLLAHDFWIVPNAFVIAAGGTIEIRGQTGTTFPKSVSAVAPERVAEARVVGASTDERISDLSVKDSSLILRHKPTTPGQRIVAVALAARASRTTPANLQRYIGLEGNRELAERYEREGAYPKSDSLTQRAAKYAKTIVEVGRGGPRAFTRTVGHALEFVPVNDPSALRAGDSLAVRLMFRGQPVAGAHLHAGTAAPPNATQDGGTQTQDLSFVTGADGVAKVPLARSGLWNVRTLHAAPAAGASGEWEVAFATLVFDVAAAPNGGSAPIESRTEVTLPASDSSDVAAAVVAYHVALASGDSTAAVALLTPDALIVESGGIETLTEYRSHHLPADIGFARAIKSERGPVRVVVQGDAAWATSTSTAQGEYRGRQINSSSAELMVLSRTAAGWKIRAIHWSSRARRPQ